MKKTLSLIILIASLGILSAAITAGDITAITPTTSVLSSSAASISFTIANALTGGDKIVFAIGTNPESIIDPSFDIPALGIAAQTPTTESFTFTTAGTYNLYLQHGSDYTKQGAITYIVNPPTNSITNISPKSATINVPILLTLTLSDPINLMNGDTLTFSKLSSTVDTAATTEKFTYSSIPTAILSNSFTFTSTGTYNLFLTRDSLTSQITSMSILVNPVAPLATLITAVTPTTATSNTATDFTFTLIDASALKISDKIVFSTSNTPSDSDTAITVSNAPTTTSFVGSATLKSAGTYLVFVSNGTPTAQTGITIVVATHSTWISMSLALGALLLMI